MALTKPVKRWLGAVVVLTVIVALSDYLAIRHHAGHPIKINSYLKNNNTVR